MRRSRSWGSAAAAAAEAGASRRVPGEQRQRQRVAAGKSEHLPRPARRRSMSAPPVHCRRACQPRPPSPSPAEPPEEHLLLLAIWPGAGTRSRTSLRALGALGWSRCAEGEDPVLGPRRLLLFLERLICLNRLEPGMRMSVGSSLPLPLWGGPFSFCCLWP